MFLLIETMVHRTCKLVLCDDITVQDKAATWHHFLGFPGSLMDWRMNLWKNIGCRRADVFVPTPALRWAFYSLWCLFCTNFIITWQESFRKFGLGSWRDFTHFIGMFPRMQKTNIMNSHGKGLQDRLGDYSRSLFLWVPLLILFLSGFYGAPKCRLPWG